jgi:hypothetical protein
MPSTTAVLNHAIRSASLADLGTLKLSTSMRCAETDPCGDTLRILGCLGRTATWCARGNQAVTLGGYVVAEGTGGDPSGIHPLMESGSIQRA